MKPLEAGDKVICRESEWHCLCGAAGCAVHDGEVLTVSARQYFPGLGACLQFEERRSHASDDDNPPWFVGSGFKLRVN